MILLVDNYDSFTYNLYQYLGELGAEVQVIRNDAKSLMEIEDMAPEAIIISPGPKTPKEAGRSMDIIKHFAGRIPILGICLGHQAIGEVFGGKVAPAKSLYHGKTSTIQHEGEGIFEGLEQDLQVARYHSLILEPESLPTILKVTAKTEDDVIMAVQHKDYPIYGLQFHPESILTTGGKRLLQNFIHMKEA